MDKVEGFEVGSADVSGDVYVRYPALNSNPGNMFAGRTTEVRAGAITYGKLARERGFTFEHTWTGLFDQPHRPSRSEMRACMDAFYGRDPVLASDNRCAGA